MYILRQPVIQKHISLEDCYSIIINFIPLFSVMHFDTLSLSEHYYKFLLKVIEFHEKFLNVENITLNKVLSTLKYSRSFEKFFCLLKLFANKNNLKNVFAICFEAKKYIKIF